ncbi:hypothetical protein [Caproiciproducens faecalis]|uniref:Uncharacterized protein n=1 Tax=Caproiciproducens faecalis TaxID=2820301 RepID=A0ABS7DMU5_9FIRM|nr:hypothetical protein [Caproiciproducens faecalis]MBW7572623.1 hypothetical protein [Caproiciproducens faecalis]
MEYRHKMMRTAVGAVVEKAIRDIRDDPRRSIRNLADMGDNFSKTAAQKHFFEIAHEVLKNPDNPYFELILNIIRNVDAETVKTVSLNFGYSSLNYGAEILRIKQAAVKKKLPWLLRFAYSVDNSGSLGFERVEEIVSDAVTLGIYTYVFQIEDSAERLEQILNLCRKHEECCFFTAVTPNFIFDRNREWLMKTPNLILSVDLSAGCGEEETGRALLQLHREKCFYGFHVRYTGKNVERLTSEEFRQRMIDCGCIFGCYVNADRSNRELEDRVYGYVCSKRGKKGGPLFVFDLERDKRYIADAILCGTDFLIGPDGTARLADGCLADLHLTTLSALADMADVEF